MTVGQIIGIDGQVTAVELSEQSGKAQCFKLGARTSNRLEPKARRFVSRSSLCAGAQRRSVN